MEDYAECEGCLDNVSKDEITESLSKYGIIRCFNCMDTDEGE